ncbi:hypothetical protein H8356DRAFT_1361363, partial [Neocallimastix lanati (nom. inval.)]
MNSDCTMLPNCCEVSTGSHKIACENGLMEKLIFSSFPLLPNLKILGFEDFFEFSNLEELILTHSNIKELPSLSSPYTSLHKLDLSLNENIKFIPDGLGELSELNILYLGYTGLTCLPKDIYKLSKLKNFDVDNNPNLNVKLYKFGNTIENCDVRNTQVSCYEPNTCINFVLDENTHATELATSRNYEQCGSFDSDDSFCTSSSSSSSTSTSRDSGGNSNILWIILSIIAVILFIVCLILFWRRKKSKDNKSTTSSIDDDIMIVMKLLLQGNIPLENNNNNNATREVSPSDENNVLPVIKINDNTNSETGSIESSDLTDCQINSINLSSSDIQLNSPSRLSSEIRMSSLSSISSGLQLNSLS